jgi:hypothetical protein
MKRSLVEIVDQDVHDQAPRRGRPPKSTRSPSADRLEPRAKRIAKAGSRKAKASTHSSKGSPAPSYEGGSASPFEAQDSDSAPPSSPSSRSSSSGHHKQHQKQQPRATASAESTDKLRAGGSPSKAASSSSPSGNVRIKEEPQPKQLQPPIPVRTVKRPTSVPESAAEHLPSTVSAHRGKPDSAGRPFLSHDTQVARGLKPPAHGKAHHPPVKDIQPVTGPSGGGRPSSGKFPAAPRPSLLGHGASASSSRHAPLFPLAVKHLNHPRKLHLATHKVPGLSCDERLDTGDVRDWYGEGIRRSVETFISNLSAAIQRNNIDAPPLRASLGEPSTPTLNEAIPAWRVTPPNPSAVHAPCAVLAVAPNESPMGSHPCIGFFALPGPGPSWWGIDKDA